MKSSACRKTINKYICTLVSATAVIFVFVCFCKIAESTAYWIAKKGLLYLLKSKKTISYTFDISSKIFRHTIKILNSKFQPKSAFYHSKKKQPVSLWYLQTFRYVNLENKGRQTVCGESKRTHYINTEMIKQCFLLPFTIPTDF